MTDGCGCSPAETQPQTDVMVSVPSKLPGQSGGFARAAQGEAEVSEGPESQPCGPLAGLQHGGWSARRPRGKVFSHLICPAKGARSAHPALGKQEAGEEASADAKAKAESSFLTDELRNGLAGRWAPLGYTALSLPIRHRRETAVRPPSPPPSPAPCKISVGSSLSTEGSGAVDSGRRSIPSLLRGPR